MTSSVVANELREPIPDDLRVSPAFVEPGAVRNRVFLRTNDLEVTVPVAFLHMLSSLVNATAPDEWQADFLHEYSDAGCGRAGGETSTSSSVSRPPPAASQDVSASTAVTTPPILFVRGCAFETKWRS